MQLKDIKKLYRLYMNGIVSHSMRQKGAAYRVNFGLTLPLLRRIAQQVPPSPQIAEELWHDTGVRESMLLAPMLYPIEQCTLEVAQRWASEIPNVEVADFCCKYLFSQLHSAPQLAGCWITSTSSLLQYTGFRLAYSLLNDIDDTEWLKETSRQAIAIAHNNEGAAAQAAQRYLTEALMLKTAGRIVVELLQKDNNIDNSWRTNLIALYDEEL